MKMAKRPKVLWKTVITELDILGYSWYHALMVGEKKNL